MSKQKLIKSVTFSTLFAGLLGMSTVGVFAQQVSQTSASYQKALITAEVLNDIMRATRKHYTQMVVSKLKKDGTGATLDHESQQGYVPLPAQFARRIAYELTFEQMKNKEKRFDIRLRSRWNLNESQDLQDDFEQRGWEFLAKQQEDQLAGGGPLQKIDWTPYIEMSEYRGKPMLRYFSADTATSPSCVSCHNAQEALQEVQNRRKKQGIEVGKTFQHFELMGAFSINVVLD